MDQRMFPRHLRPPRANIDYVPLQPKGGMRDPVFVLHTRERHEMFAFHLEQEDETTRSCIAVFMKEADALVYGKLLERHKKAVGDWPGRVSSDPKIDLAIEKDTALDLDIPLTHLYVEAWGQEEAQDLCIHASVNMLLFYDVQVTKTPSMGLKIDMNAGLAEIEVADTYLRQKYEVLFTNTPSADDYGMPDI